MRRTSRVWVWVDVTPVVNSKIHERPLLQVSEIYQVRYECKAVPSVLRKNNGERKKPWESGGQKSDKVCAHIQNFDVERLERIITVGEQLGYGFDLVKFEISVYETKPG